MQKSVRSKRRDKKYYLLLNPQYSIHEELITWLDSLPPELRKAAMIQGLLHMKNGAGTSVPVFPSSPEKRAIVPEEPTREEGFSMFMMDDV